MNGTQIVLKEKKKSKELFKDPEDIGIMKVSKISRQLKV